MGFIKLITGFVLGAILILSVAAYIMSMKDRISREKDKEFRDDRQEED